MKQAITAAAMAGYAAAGVVRGSLQVDVGGQAKTVYVVSGPGDAGHVQMVPNGFTLRGGGRVYFAEKQGDDFSPDMFWQIDLLGKHFSYDIDVSKVDCGCNAAAYFVNMPAEQRGAWGDYYCDANHGNNQWCPEYDTYEGNKYTFASTPHTCNSTSQHGCSWCDGGGCQTNAFRVDQRGYCPRGDCKIDTTKKFTISHASGASGGTMTSMNDWLHQGDNTFSFDVCGRGDYLAQMGQSLRGTVFAASLWGGGGVDMRWLDGMTGCQERCDLGAQQVTFSNFRVEPNTAEQPRPSGGLELEGLSALQ